MGKGKLNDEIHITRTHFGTSHRPQNSMNCPNYSGEIRQFFLTVRTDNFFFFFFRKFIKKTNIDFFNIYYINFKENVIVQRRTGCNCA